MSELEARAATSRLARWQRSLFAIYDIDDMVRLDLPWWTLDAIDRVDAFLKERPNAQVFEYGSGASTIWLARRSGQVTSVEHDAGWFEILSGKVAAYPGVHVMLTTPDARTREEPLYQSKKPSWRGNSFHDYVHAIDSTPGEFDLIVVDGRARPGCLSRAKDRLARGGLIVFDNSGRSHYQRAIQSSGLRIEETRGLTACLPYPDQTTLLFNA